MLHLNLEIMKKLILVLLIGIFTVSVNAQKKSTLNRDQVNLAYVKAKSLKKTGIVITLSGCVLVGTGKILTDQIKYDPNTGYMSQPTYHGFGVLLAGIGIGLTAIGIPLWATGATKKKNIEVGLKKFQGSASATGIGLKIRF